MNHRIYACTGLLALLAALGIGSMLLEKRAAVAAASVDAPQFEVDPLWPKPLPNHWILGMTVGVSVDAQDHIWIVHRTNAYEPTEVYATAKPPAAECCLPAPPVLEFDEEGNLIGHWGGPGAGYDWPDSNHGITVDYKGNVWIGGNSRGPDPKGYHDNMVLKFTQSGKFLMQIGHPGKSQGSNDTENLKGPAKLFVDGATDELYVADGYGNHRVIVYDADTGKYKRHWGAYGKRPDDANLGKYNPEAPPSQQFANPVHCVRLSHDGLVYVCDRVNDRIHVFRKDGTFVKEFRVEPQTLANGSVWDLVLSEDPAQNFIFIADGANNQIVTLKRDSGEVLTSWGRGGRMAGQFKWVHNIGIDSKGNLYTAEVGFGRRAQKFRRLD